MRPTPPLNRTHMLCMDKKQSLTGIDTQAKLSICCGTSAFMFGHIYDGSPLLLWYCPSLFVCLSIKYHIFPAFKYFLETCLICLSNGYSKKTYAVIWSVKVIHSDQSSNVNILCIRHNLNGLKLVHENTVYAVIFAVFQFSRYFAVSMNPRKLKSHNIFLFLSKNRR